MKKTCLFVFLVSLLLLSCGDSQQNFKIEGNFKGFNQGELYVYSMDGSRKLDTIGVSRGEFVYQASISEPTTLVVVFPNYSELPVFAEPGVTIKMYYPESNQCLRRIHRLLRGPGSLQKRSTQSPGPPPGPHGLHLLRLQTPGRR